MTGSANSTRVSTRLRSAVEHAVAKVKCWRMLSRKAAGTDAQLVSADMLTAVTGLYSRPIQVMMNVITLRVMRSAGPLVLVGAGSASEH